MMLSSQFLCTLRSATDWRYFFHLIYCLLIKVTFLQDLLANPKCSLLVAKDPEDRTDLVITLHGDVVSVSI